MAQLIMRALDHGGHQVHLASQHRAYDGKGSVDAQTTIKREGDRQALGLLDAYNDDKIPQPHVWFTYHLYHKAPDWIGPRVSEALKIPYVVAEASYAAKQIDGPWDQGLSASKRGIEMADRVISFNATDDPCIAPLLKPKAKLERIPPFVETQPYAQASRDRTIYRAMAAGQYDVEPGVPWLMCVAMMRPGDKLRSYEILGATLAKILDRDWRLLVVGDGEARDQVKAALHVIGHRTHWIGAQDTDSLPGLYAASDLYVWPAINEAFGISFVEAQASGLPVVAGDTRGVSGIVNAPECGTLVPLNDSDALASAIADMLDNPDQRNTMAAKAQSHTWKHHGLSSAATKLDQILSDVTS